MHDIMLGVAFQEQKLRDAEAEHALLNEQLQDQIVNLKQQLNQNLAAIEKFREFQEFYTASVEAHDDPEDRREGSRTHGTLRRD